MSHSYESNLMFTVSSPIIKKCENLRSSYNFQSSEGEYGLNEKDLILLRQAQLLVLLTLSGSRMLRCTRQTISFTVISIGTLSGIEQVTVSAAGEPSNKAFLCASSAYKATPSCTQIQFPTAQSKDPSQCSFQSTLLAASYFLQSVFCLYLSCPFPQYQLIPDTHKFPYFLQDYTGIKR